MTFHQAHIPSHKVPRGFIQRDLGVFQKLSSGGGGPQALLCPVGEGVWLTICPRGGESLWPILSGGWGWGVQLSWGSRCIWSMVGQGLIKAITCPGGGGSGSQNCPEGWGALTPCVSWGWRGLKKIVAHTPLRIISGTALSVSYILQLHKIGIGIGIGVYLYSTTLYNISTARDNGQLVTCVFHFFIAW